MFVPSLNFPKWYKWNKQDKLCKRSAATAIASCKRSFDGELMMLTKTIKTKFKKKKEKDGVLWYFSCSFQAFFFFIQAAYRLV